MTKIKRRAPKAIDDTRLKTLWGSRLSDADLAKALGHHQSTVRRRAAKLGLPSSRRELWARQP